MCFCSKNEKVKNYIKVNKKKNQVFHMMENMTKNFLIKKKLIKR